MVKSKKMSKGSLAVIILAVLLVLSMVLGLTGAWFTSKDEKNGTTDVAFTVLDVLGYLDEIPVCVGYDIDGEVTTDFPTTHLLEKAKPVLKKLPGWKCDIRGIKKYEDLPENCRNYIEFVEEQIGYPITMVSNGPERHDIIYRESKLSK